MILAAKNQKQTNTGGLVKLLKLKIRANVNSQCRHTRSSK